MYSSLKGISSLSRRGGGSKKIEYIFWTPSYIKDEDFPDGEMIVDKTEDLIMDMSESTNEPINIKTSPQVGDGQAQLGKAKELLEYCMWHCVHLQLNLYRYNWLLRKFN